MKRKQTMRRGLGILLSLVMCLSLLPATALAAEPATETAYFTRTNEKEISYSLELLKSGGGDASWDSSTKTLTLKGVNFTTKAETAVTLPAGATIKLEDGTANTITSVYDGVGTSGCALGAGDLAIEGGGTLTVESGKANHSFGIRVYEGGSLTIRGGTVKATGGTAAEKSCGIYTDDGGITISDSAKVTAAGGTAQKSCGIYAYQGDVTISGGTVTTEAGTATGNNDYSCGIYAYQGDVTISGGTVKATGGTATGNNDYNCGICAGADKKITISGGHVIARALGGAYNGQSLSKAPDLRDYTGYYWRTSSRDSFTSSADTEYSHNNEYTYVEFSDGCTYTITLDPNYEGGKPSTVFTGADGKLSELPTPTRDGYTFEGWFTEDGTTAVTTATEFTEDTVLSAHWTQAEETETGKAIRLGTSQINGGQASSVYFGNYQQSSDGNGGFNNDPIKWRVLSNADGKLFLLADQNLDVKEYSTWSNAAINWNNSTLRTWVNGTFLNAAFSNVEQGAIAETYVYNATQSDGISKPNPSYNTSGGSNTTDKIFLLSIEEANNTSYFTNIHYSRGATNTAYVASKSSMNDEGKNNSWWLRSPGDLGNRAAYVGASGSVNDYGIDARTVNIAVRPAFNLDLNSVLFTSAAEDGKSADGMGSGLTAVGDYNGSEWKLTLQDSSRDSFSIFRTTMADDTGTVSFSYSGAKTGTNEYISAVVVESGAITHYGRILHLDGTTNGTSGTASLSLPAGVTLGENTELYVFNEQYNGDKKTDYASAFETVTLTVDTTAPTLTAGDVSRTGESTATVKFIGSEAGEYYYAVVESNTAEPNIVTVGAGPSCTKSENTISLTDLTGEGAKDIYIVVKDAAGNVSEKLKIEIPVYVAPVYSISVSPASLYFGSQKKDYDTLSPQSIFITNTGNQTITFEQPNAENYLASNLNPETVEPGQSVFFLILPSKGLTDGNYDTTLTISGSNGVSASVSLFFTVTSEDHSHEYGTDWKSDADNHWHACSCGDRKNIEEHTASNWITDTAATATTDGTKHKECTFCGYVMETGTIPATGGGEHTHSYGSEWKSNADNHWHECSCGAKSEEAAHTASDWITDTAATATTDGTKHKECTFCGYVMETGTIPATGGSSSSGSSGGSSAPTYVPTVTQPENGAVTVSPKAPKKGDTVTITPKPEAGYTVEQILVTDKDGNPVKVTNNGDGTFSFTQPAGKVNVEVTFMEDNTMLNFFVDVPAGAYYYDAVLWAAENGITGGVDDTHFAPDASCTRGQMVTFLWRAAGSPKVSGSNPFSDVSADAYYYDAVLWAVEKGITSGTSATTFAPDATVTRGQTVTFLYRAAGSPAASGSGFSDVSSDAYYADAVAWAVQQNITTGTGDGKFSPDADCTRAQIVTFLFRAMGE